MLYADGEHVLGIEADGLPVQISGLHMHLARAFDLGPIIGHGKAAFLTFHEAALHNGRHGRIDQHHFAFALFRPGDVDDHQTQEFAHLRRGDADAVRFVHEFAHFLGELADFFGHFGNGLAGLAQQGIRVGYYFQWHKVTRTRIGFRVERR